MHTIPRLAIALATSAALAFSACGDDGPASSDDAVTESDTDSRSDGSSAAGEVDLSGVPQELLDQLGLGDLDAEELANLDVGDLASLGLDQLDPAILAQLEQMGIDLDGTGGNVADDEQAESADEGGDDADNGSGGAFDGDACSLGADEIAALVGPPATPSASEEARAQTCTWEGQPGQYGTPRTLAVHVWQGEEFWVDPTQLGDANVTAVPDLGSDGWVTEVGAHVMWKQDGMTVDVQVPLGGPSEAELIAVAHAVADDLS